MTRHAPVILAVLLLLLLPEVHAAVTYYQHNETSDTAYDIPRVAGFIMYINDSNTKIYNMTNIPTAGAGNTKGFLYNMTGLADNDCPALTRKITECTISGTTCTFNSSDGVQLTNGDSYFFGIGDNDQASDSHNMRYRNSGMVWPRQTPVGNITKLKQFIVGGTPASQCYATATSDSYIIPEVTFSFGTNDPATYVITFNLNNSVNNSLVPGFCVTATGNGTISNCTTGTSTTLGNISGLLNFSFTNITGNHTSYTYFDTVLNSQSITGSTTITGQTFQAWLLVNATRLFLNTPVTTFNVTHWSQINTTSAGNVLIKANNGTNTLHIDVPGNFSNNQTCTGTSLNTNTCTLTGIYDARLRINVTEALTTNGVSNFTVTIINGTLGLSNTTSTTNGTIYFNLLQGYNYSMNISVPNNTLQVKNASTYLSTFTPNYTFYLLPAPSINITIRNILTNALITANVTISLVSNTTGYTFNTSTGNAFISNITPDTYEITVAAANYSTSEYTVTITDGYSLDLTAYLQETGNSVVMALVDFISTNLVIEGASVDQQGFLNGSWVTISSRTTDITGRTRFYYTDDFAYRFIVIADGYNSKTFTLDPILFDSYTIKLTRTTAINFSQDYQSLYITYDPTLFYDAQENTINITFASPLGTFTNYNYTLHYPGGTKNGTGTNAVGQSFVVPFNITGSTYTSKVNITIGYDTTLDVPKSFSASYGIIISPGTTTFIHNQDTTYGMGLLERVFIGTLIIIIIAGLITLALGPIPALGIALIIMGVFIKIGFWEWWLAGISFLIGLAIISARSD